MARQNPLPASEVANCRRFKALRMRLRIPRTEFALMLGMSAENLTAREVERNRFQEAEIPKVKTIVRSHLAGALAAFETTFGHPAFPSDHAALDIRRPRKMKLLNLPPQAVSQVKTAAEEVDAILTNLPPWSQAITELQREDAGLEEEAANLTASGKHDRATVQTLQAIGTQRSLIAEKIATAEAELQEQCQAAASILRATAKIIFGVCWGPLSSQLMAEVNASFVSALAPYGVAPAQAERFGCELDDLPVGRALQAFVSHGENIGYSTFNRQASAVPPERVLQMAREFKVTLTNIQEGRDVFVFTPQAQAA